MKIFQKFMSLILVIAMIGSFAFAATPTYRDANAIAQTEAVEVMSALGVINGYPDGTMKPNDTVTRAEMAKMIAFILNKGDDVGAMYAGACTFADTASHWAAGYVAYCAQAGIINGKNATTFDPDAPVTGTEAAKMVLGMLGHEGEKAGLTGASWASTTMSLAAKNNLVGVTNNLDVNMGQALSRENTARLLLNGLQANMVEYKGGTNISIGNVTLTQGAEATVIAQTGRDFAGRAEDTAKQLAEEYFPTLLLNDTGIDAFGRVCNEWIYENETVGFYSQTPYIVFTTEVTLGDLYTKLGKVDVNKLNSITYYVDGEQVDASKMQNLKSGEYLTTIGGQGVTTEVYFDNITMDLSIVEINVYAGTIAQVVDARRDANGDIYTEGYVVIKPADGAKIGVAGWDLTGAGTTPANSTLTDLFTQADRNAVVYYTVGRDTSASNYVSRIQTVTPAMAITGVNKGYSMFNGKTVSVTIDSIKYAVNATSSYMGGTIGQAETIYLDNNGNVIYSTGVVSKNYCLVLETAKTSLFGNGYSALIITSTGEEKIVELSNLTDATAMQKNTIYNYSVNSEGKYNMTACTTETANAISNRNAVIGSNVADNNTSFVVGTEASLNSNVYMYTTYTGVAAVPSFTGDAYYTNDPYTGKIAVVFCRDAEMTGISNNDVIAVYSTGDEPYITTMIGETMYTYYTVPAIIGGITTEIRVNDQAYAQLTTGYNFFAGCIIDTNNIYTSFYALNTNYYKVDAFATFDSFDKGIVKFDDVAKYLEAETPAYVWNKATETLTISRVDALYNVVGGGFYTTTISYTNVETISGVYVTVEY